METAGRNAGRFTFHCAFRASRQEPELMSRFFDVTFV
jgi:hypothetical protein